MKHKNIQGEGLITNNIDYLSLKVDIGDQNDVCETKRSILKCNERVATPVYKCCHLKIL
jgi:hypothetical protein